MKIIILFSLLFFISIEVCCAQTYDLGIGLFKLNAKDTAGTYETDIQSIQLYGGMNIPLIKLGTEGSISPQINGAVSVGQSLFLATLPINLLLNFGCDATRKSTKRIGGAAGLGVNFIFLSLEGRNMNYSSPCLFGEFHILTPTDTLLKLKGVLNFSDTNSKTFPNDPSAVFNGTMNVKYPFALYLTYTLNY